MKKHILSRITLALVCSLSPICLNTINAFADNPYGIVYEGGELLGENNVNINPELINSLEDLFNSGNVVINEFSDSDKWVRTGSTHITECNNSFDARAYVRVDANDPITPEDDVWYKFTDGVYTAKIKFNAVAFDDPDASWQAGEGMTPLVVQGRGIYGRYSAYSDDSCQNKISVSPGGNMFVEMTITIYRNDNLDEPFAQPGIYFGVTDIDSRQSFKILNKASEFNAKNIYAARADYLQPENFNEERGIFFVEDENYIYANPYFNVTGSRGSIYSAVDVNDQLNGLRVVFGWNGHSAASRIHYLKTNLFVVTYESDENGEITGQNHEDVLDGGNPTGSATRPSEGYELAHWVADEDVELTDGTKIPAGSPITMGQILEVVVRQNITFTAIHQAIPIVPGEPDVPSSGAMTINDSAATAVGTTTKLGVVLSVATILMITVYVIKCVRK